MKKVFFILTLLFSTLNCYPQENNEINIGTTTTIKSEVLGEERQILISLPQGYANSQAKYPVLYLLDGNAHFNYASGMVNYLSTIGRIPQMIVVAIPNTIRNRDFTPTIANNVPASGGAVKFQDFLESELIPYIETRYRVQPYKIIFGHSLTGMFSLYTFLTRPELFNAYIMASPYVIYDNNYIVTLAGNRIKKSYDKLRILYFTVGDEPEYIPQLDKLMQTFNSANAENVKWKFVPHKEYNHGTIPINAIYDGLLDIFDIWSVPEGFPLTGTVDSLQAHYEKVSNKLGYDVTPAEGLVNIIGYQAMAAGRIDEALKFFELNIDYYPKSANVYDSYGEGLEKAGKIEDAYENYTKAVKLGTEINDPNLEVFRQHVEAIKKNHAGLIE